MSIYPYATNGGTSATNVLTYSISVNSTGNSTWLATPTSSDSYEYGTRDALDILAGKVVVPKRALALELPDGSTLHVDEMGNYRMDDADAKVIYQANRMREFNPYVNASDQLARFIRYLGSLGLKRQEAGNIPISLFINWLVLEAAEMDGDPVPDGVPPIRSDRLLVGKVASPRCPACARFVRLAMSQRGYLFCGPPCADRLYQRLAA